MRAREADATARTMLVAQLHLLERSLPSIVLGTFVAGAIVALALRGALPTTTLALWFGALAALSGVRLAYLARCWRERTTLANATSRHRTMMVFSFGSSVLWGTLGYIGITASDPFASLMLVMVLTGLVASATAVIAHLPSMYALYTLPMMLPAVAKVWQIGEPVEVRWLAVLVLLYLVVALIAAGATGATVRESIALRFENTDLIAGLREERERAEAAAASETRSNLAKSRFLAAASHDLRQPLHSLRLFTASLESQSLESRHKHLASRIGASVKALEELFDAILDISKLDAGTLEAHPRHFRLESTLGSLASDFAPLAFERALALRIDRGDPVVHTDPMLLERLLRNLLSNAVRYTERGEVRVRVTTIADRVRVSVSDTGPGIAAADRERVFEEFVQLDNPERDRSQGIGLGLSIVRRIAHLLALELTLDSEPGAGTTVHVDVPAGERSRVEEALEPPSPRPEAAPLALSVLVVDDEEGSRAAMEELLSLWGCDVPTASSAAEALQVLEESGCRPDAVLSDYRLRDHERGSDTIAAVRGRYGTALPGMLVTGDVSAERLREIRASGLPVMHKPTDPGRLREWLERVERGLGRSGA